MKITNQLTRISIAFIICISAAGSLAQVSYERILNAADEPENWLTYNGGYKSQRYSQLDQITPENVADLKLQ